MLIVPMYCNMCLFLFLCVACEQEIPMHFNGHFNANGELNLKLETAWNRVPRCKPVDLPFLKNRKNLSKSLNKYFSKQTFVTQISPSCGVPGTTYFEMGVRGQMHVILGVLDVKKFENH